MPTFRDLLASDAARLQALDAFVDRLLQEGPRIAGRFTEAARNFQAEGSLTGVFWQRVADRLSTDLFGRTLEEIEEALAVEFRSFQRQGAPNTESRTRFGRVWNRILYEDALMADGRTSTEAAEEAFRLTFLSPDELRDFLRFRRLGGHLMWSTFCELCDCSDPFSPRLDAHLQIDALGLPFRNGDEFLMFSYELPVGLAQTHPTIADAYSGSFFFPYRVGGRTQPIRYGDTIPGRPEVVHQTITGRYLVAAVEMLQPIDQVSRPPA